MKFSSIWIPCGQSLKIVRYRQQGDGQGLKLELVLEQQ